MQCVNALRSISSKHRIAVGSILLATYLLFILFNSWNSGSEMFTRICHDHDELLDDMSSELRYEIATRKHADDIYKFMLSEFGTNEPITCALNPATDDLCDFFRDLSEAGYSNEKYSTVVYDKDRLVAICLCSVKQYTEGVGEIPPEIDVEHHDFGEEIQKGSYKQHKANQLVTYVSALEHRQRRLLGNNTKVLKLDIICVLSECKGRGLGKELTRRAIETARAEGCEWVATAATACASQAIFAKCGLQVLYEVPFSIFRENGNEVFRNLHDGCKGGKFMAIRVKQ